MSQTAAVIQKPEETPTDFYERLREVFWLYTPFDPEAPELSMQCLWPSHTLTFSGNFKNLKASLERVPPWLLKVPNKIFVNWEREEK
jgi:hypothetical protein